MNNFSKKLKQYLAIFSVIIIVLLYLITLVLAIMNNSYTKTFFQASLFSSVFLPLMLYLFIWIAGILKSYNPNNSENKTAPSKKDNAVKK